MDSIFKCRDHAIVPFVIFMLPLVSTGTGSSRIFANCALNSLQANVLSGSISKEGGEYLGVRKDTLAKEGFTTT